MYPYSSKVKKQNQTFILYSSLIYKKKTIQEDALFVYIVEKKLQYIGPVYISSFIRVVAFLLFSLDYFFFIFFTYYLLLNQQAIEKVFLQNLLCVITVVRQAV